MQTKLSSAEVGQMMKMAAENLRALSAENDELKTKVAHFERKARAEKIASAMQEKNLQPELPYSEKVAALMKRENLDVIEEAIGLTAPQMKFASAPDDMGLVESENGEVSNRADSQFFTNLLSDQDGI